MSLSIAHFLHSHPAPLTPVQLELAPLCITAADIMLALKEIQPSVQREGFLMSHGRTLVRCTLRTVTASCIWPLYSLFQLFAAGAFLRCG
jgi:hypothetical protein